MEQEYKDRSAQEIYNDITAEKERIDAWLLWNGNRDDEDAYQAAMNIINKYLTEDYETFNANNNWKIEDKRYYVNLDNRWGRYEFAFNEYHKLYMQFKQEHNDLEAKWTRHYPWQSESEHINRLASRINEIEYDSLINRRVHDAKYSLIDNNKLITSIPDPTAPGYSFIDTPPQFTEGANGKTVAEIFEMTEEKQDPGTIYKIDFSWCTNPDMKDRPTVYVNSNGKMITKEWGGTILETDAYTTTETDITVWEWVTISSSKYMSTLADYELNLDKSIFDKYKNNTVNTIWYNNYTQLLQSNDIPNDSKYGKSLNILKEKHPKLYGAISNLYEATLQSLPKWSDIPHVTINWIDYKQNFLYEFLAASETKLEHIIVKNKKTWFRLANEPITTTWKWIVQANIVGVKDNNREVFFSKGSRWNIWQTVCISNQLYNLLDNYDDELVDYLTERIRASWEGDPKYANITLHDTKINESEMKTIKNPNNEKEKEKFNAEYQLKLYTLTELSQLCYDFEQRYDDIQPPELINVMTYIDNVAYDMRRGFNNGKLPTDKKWWEICQEFQRLWLEFKDHDWNRASMRDPTARTYIHNIFYAKNQDTIDRYIKELWNWMTFLDNTTWQHAVENLTRRAIDNASEASKDEKVIQIEKPKIDEYRQLLIKDFGMKEDEKWNPVPMNKTAMDALINAYNSNRDEKSVFNYLMWLTDDGKKDKNRTQYLPNGTDPDDVEDECKNILAGLKSKKELLESNTWKLTPELMKKKLKDQKEELEKRSHLSDDEISRLNGIEVVMEDPECLQKLINDENEAMEISIRYWDMEELISGTLTPYYIKEWGWIKWFDNAWIINDALWAWWWFLNFSDQGCEKVWPMLNMILQEVAICAIAAAVGTFTAWMWTAAIMAARWTAFWLKVVKVASNLRRVRCIGSMCKLAWTGAKYLERISFAIKNSPKFQRFARWFRIAPTTTTSAGAGTEASLLWRAALATEEVVTSTRAWRVIRNGTETVLNMARKWNQLKEIWTSMKAVRFLLEWTWFHITSTALHNAINGNNFWQWMNPFWSTEYIDPETWEKKEMSNFRWYLESCAFLWIIKAIWWPIQALTRNWITKLLWSKASEYKRLAGFFGGVVSITWEMASMWITDQAISLTFDQKLKGITVEDLIHTVGMVLWLRLTHYIWWKYDKFVVKEYNKAKWEVFVDAIWKDWKPITIKVSKNWDIVRVSDSNTKKPIEDSELKGKNIYTEKNKPQEESSIDQKLFDDYVKAQEANLRERYKRFNGDDLKISPEDLQRILKQTDTEKMRELIDKIEDESTKKFLEEDLIESRLKDLEWDEWNDYFDDKSRKIFKGSEKDARTNSETSDRILDEITEENMSEKLEELRKAITEQYESSTWQKLELSNEQLLSILDAHEQDWILWQITRPQLRRKVTILEESIKDDNVKRFLLEAGFCWKSKSTTTETIQSQDKKVTELKEWAKELYEKENPGKKYEDATPKEKSKYETKYEQILAHQNRAKELYERENPSKKYEDATPKEKADYEQRTKYIEVKWGKENAGSDIETYIEKLKTSGNEKIDKIIKEKLETMKRDIKELDVDFDPVEWTFRAFWWFEWFVRDLASRRKIDQNFLNNIKLTIDNMTKKVINDWNGRKITRKEYKDWLWYPDYLTEALEKYMVNQWLDNPQYFVSHGYDHTILVDSLIVKVYKWIEGAKNSIKDRYWLREDIVDELAEQIVRLSAQCHDFWYPEQIWKSKTTHATKWAERFRKDIMPKVEKWLWEKGVTPENAKKLCRDIYNSIFFHWADKVEWNYATKVEGINEWETYWSVLTPGDKPIKNGAMREYIDFENYRVSYKSENNRKIAQQQALELSTGWNSDITIYTKEHPNWIKFKKIDGVWKDGIEAHEKFEDWRDESWEPIKLKDLIENWRVTKIEWQNGKWEKVSVEIEIETQSNINNQVLKEAFWWTCDFHIQTDKWRITYDAKTKKFKTEKWEEISEDDLINNYKFKSITAGEDWISFKIDYENYQWRELDEEGNMGGAWLEYKRGDLADNPILAAIWVADNLDMTRSRAIPTQSNAITQCALNNLDIDNWWKIAKLFDRMSNYNKALKKYNEYLAKLKQYENWEIKEKPQEVKPPSDEEKLSIQEELKEIFEWENIDISQVLEEEWYETEKTNWEYQKKKAKFKSYDENRNEQPYNLSRYFKDGKFDLAKFKQDLFQSIRESWKIQSHIGNETLDMSRDLMSEDIIWSFSVRHIVWLRTIKDVNFEWNNWKWSVKIEIDMDAYFNSDLTYTENQKWERTLREVTEKKGKKVPLVEYHIWREWTALSSKSYKWKRIDSYVVARNPKWELEVIWNICSDWIVDYSPMFESWVKVKKTKDGELASIDYSKGKLKQEWIDKGLDKSNPLFKNRP